MRFLVAGNGTTGTQILQLIHNLGKLSKIMFNFSKDNFADFCIGFLNQNGRDGALSDSWYPTVGCPMGLDPGLRQSADVLDTASRILYLVQCSAVRCNLVQCVAVQCSAAQYSAVQCNAVQCSAGQCSVVQ